MRSNACLICDLSITNILNQKSSGLFLDSAILDPMDKELMAAIVTTKLLLGEDNHCMNYLKASRSGLFD